MGKEWWPRATGLLPVGVALAGTWLAPEPREAQMWLLCRTVAQPERPHLMPLGSVNQWF